MARTTRSTWRRASLATSLISHFLLISIFLTQRNTKYPANATGGNVSLFIAVVGWFLTDLDLPKGCYMAFWNLLKGVKKEKKKEIKKIHSSLGRKPMILWPSWYDDMLQYYAQTVVGQNPNLFFLMQLIFCTSWDLWPVSNSVLPRGTDVELRTGTPR